MHRTTLVILAALAFASLPQASADGSAAPDPLDALPAAGFPRDAAAHLLRRAGFGGTPEEIDALHAKGLAAAVASLVDYEKVESDLPAFVPFQTDGPNVRDAKTEEERRRFFQEHRRLDYAQQHAVKSWWLSRMVQTKRPLEEKMTLFWHNHFTSGFRDVKNSYHMYIQNTLLRRHATGDFRAFTKAIARDLAMLEYLDNRANRKQQPNENFARELMELFTLGVGNYTERDIKEAARAFTGWTFRGNQFTDAKVLHDYGAKTILGKTGNFDGDQVIDLLLAQPSASRYIAGKLFRYFAHDAPTEAVVEALAQALRDAGWQIKPVLAKLLASREFFAPASVGTQIKSPVVLMVSLMRLTGADPNLAVMVAGVCETLGQNLLDPPNVKGWAGGRDWITTSVLFERYNAAQMLVASKNELAVLGQRMRARLQAYQRLLLEAEGMDPESMMGSGDHYAPKMTSAVAPYPVATRVVGCATAEDVVDRLTALLLARPPSAELRARLVEHLGAGKAAPFDDESLHGILKLIVSTPEFQLS